MCAVRPEKKTGMTDRLRWIVSLSRVVLLAWCGCASDQAVRREFSESLLLEALVAGTGDPLPMRSTQACFDGRRLFVKYILGALVCYAVGHWEDSEDFALLPGRKTRATVSGLALPPARHGTHPWQEPPPEAEPTRVLDGVAREAIRTRGRGVDVRVIIPLEGGTGPLDRANILAANQLFGNGIRAFLYPGTLHAEAAVCDGGACLGSADFNKASFLRNREINVSTSHPEAVARPLQRLYEPDFEIARELLEPIPEKGTDRLAEILADQLSHPEPRVKGRRTATGTERPGRPSGFRAVTPEPRFRTQTGTVTRAALRRERQAFATGKIRIPSG